MLCTMVIQWIISSQFYKNLTLYINQNLKRHKKPSILYRRLLTYLTLCVLLIFVYCCIVYFGKKYRNEEEYNQWGEKVKKRYKKENKLIEKIQS